MHSTIAHAQWTPLRLGATNEILDEFDGKLEGTSPSADQFGISTVTGDLIQVLAAPFGIFPPSTDGTPHPFNAVLHLSHIGAGTSPHIAKPARFGMSIVPRPNGEQVFVRVFNASSLEAASFYNDSQTHEVSSSSDSMFVVNVLKTDKPLDANDDDSDGLHNSWEKSYGTDPADADSDDDGVMDGDEHLAGTNPSDSNSVFVVARLLTSASGLTIEWDSVPGETYVVEYAPGSPLQGLAYTPASTSILATAEFTQFPLTSGLENAQSSYRVRHVEL